MDSLLSLLPMLKQYSGLLAAVAGVLVLTSQHWTPLLSKIPLPKFAPKDSSGCESRRLTLVGVRHKASEMPAGAEREKSLALCDEMDKLVSRLWPEASA